MPPAALQLDKPVAEFLLHICDLEFHLAAAAAEKEVVAAPSPGVASFWRLLVSLAQHEKSFHSQTFTPHLSWFQRFNTRAGPLLPDVIACATQLADLSPELPQNCRPLCTQLSWCLRKRVTTIETLGRLCVPGEWLRRIDPGVAVSLQNKAVTTSDTPQLPAALATFSTRLNAELSLLGSSLQCHTELCSLQYYSSLSALKQAQEAYAHLRPNQSERSNSLMLDFYGRLLSFLTSQLGCVFYPTLSKYITPAEMKLLYSRGEFDFIGRLSAAQRDLGARATMLFFDTKTSGVTPETSYVLKHEDLTREEVQTGEGQRRIIRSYCTPHSVAVAPQDRMLEKYLDQDNKGSDFCLPLSWSEEEQLQVICCPLVSSFYLLGLFNRPTTARSQTHIQRDFEAKAIEFAHFFAGKTLLSGLQDAFKK